MTPGSENPSGLPPTGQIPPEQVAPPSRYSFGRRAFTEQDSAQQPYLNQANDRQPDPPQWSAQQHYGQPYPTQSYGQQPYPTPPYGQPHLDQEHGQAQDRGQPYGYPQSGLPERNPYQVTPAQYYRDQGYGDPEPAQPYHLAQSSLRGPRKPSPALGITSLGVVIGMLVVCLLATQPLAAAYSAIYLTLGTAHIERGEISDQLLAPTLVPLMVVGLASIIGIIGLILGVWAAASHRGRGWGVGAIILGILAPFIWGSVLIAAILPAVAAVS